MLYRQLTDFVSLTNGGVLSALSATQTLVGKLKNEKRRLEGLLISFAATTGASAAGNHDGLAGFIKEVRVKINDVAGERFAVRASGPALVDYQRNNWGRVDRQTFRSVNLSAIASLAQQCNIWVPLRHMYIAEPFANLTSLPLSQKFLATEPVIEIDIHPAATIYSAGAPSSATVKCLAVYREVPEEVSYIPSELLTDEFKPGVTGKQSYDLATVGFLSQLMIQGYNATTYANNTQRTSVLSTGGTLSFDYGRNTWLKYDDDTLTALNDATQEQFLAVAADNLTNRTFPGVYMLDFLSDYPGADAFSVGSLVNLNTEALGGDKARLTFDTWGATTHMARITQQKFLARNRAELEALRVGI